ncbi:uncharacterized protein F4812DRAFT_440271 [Daldinia caldariorum]|uniref:uncharacterized protein n=1 Tax=Daldinia caldariorum TaxID=326644 RepID=UPI0020083A25|nr:uncharacterized protein F4812DRAFT_440271 [Daldinia caldariorum]KAI1465266.1 hypothetical protein F4812DRAFT_440271 [Daldinia caldariorum]
MKSILKLPRLDPSRTSRQHATYRGGRRPIPSTRITTTRAPFATSAARYTVVVVDQTKKSNDPSAEQKDEHREQATKTASSGVQDRGHPAKQPDPQPSPSKSTGVRSEGPGSKAGEGPDPDVSKEKAAGAGQHTG